MPAFIDGIPCAGTHLPEYLRSTGGSLLLVMKFAPNDMEGFYATYNSF